MNDKVLTYLRALADLTRFRIIALVNALPDICVCQLLETLGLPQTTVSKALGVLKKSGIVEYNRDGQWVRYRLTPFKNRFPLKEILKMASSEPAMRKDIIALNKIRKMPLDKICCNKPWRR